MYSASKKLFTKIIFIILCLMFTVVCTQAKEEKIVRVYSNEYKNLFEYNKETKEYFGFAVEYIETVAAYAGWHVEYHLTRNYADSLNKFFENKSDIFYNMTKTDLREQYFLFPTLPMGEEHFYIFAKKGNSEIRYGDKDSLQGKRIGVGTDDSLIISLKSWCKKNNINLQIIEYTSPKQKEEDLLSGKIDLDCDSALREHPDYAAVMHFAVKNNFLAVNPNRPDLLKDIEEAQQKIFTAKPFFVNNLAERYFSNLTMIKTLSPDESAWIESHNELRIGTLKNYPPFSAYDDRTGELTGSLVEISKLVLQRLNVSNITPKYYLYDDTQSMLQDLLLNKLDVIYPYYHDVLSAKRDKVMISEEVNTVPMTLIHKLSTPLRDAANKIAFVEPTMSTTFINYNFPNSVKIPCSSWKECLTAVNNGSVTGIVAYLPAITREDIKNNNLITSNMRIPCPTSFAVKKSDSRLTSFLDKGLSLISDEEASAIEYKFMPVPKATITSFLRDNFYTILSLAFVILLIITGILIMLSVTNRKLSNANALVHSQNSELEQQNILVNSQKRQLEQQQNLLLEAVRKANAANEAKSAFLFNMSHDIRTPMNAIIGFNNMALRTLKEDGIIKDCLLKVQKTSDLLLLILNDVLDMSHIEKGSISITESVTDIRNIFLNIEPMMLELAQKKNIKLSFEYSEIQFPCVYIDLPHFSRIMTNIINNAIKFTNNGGTVKVSFKQNKELKDGYVGCCLSVKDNGIGISEEFQKNIFKPFARENNSTAMGNIQGVGLGLTLCKKLVDLMHGNIYCKSKKGEGSLFTVEISLKVLEKEKIDAAPQNEKTYSFKNKKILLVDDNELNMEIASDILQQASFLVETAENGKIAVQKVREKGPDYYDYILMDIQMPVMDGYEATRMIRSLFPDKQIPIIAVSANAFEEDKRHSKEAGMNAHIAKPLDLEVLFEVLKQYL